jgi:hypothetical protein
MRRAKPKRRQKPCERRTRQELKAPHATKAADSGAADGLSDRAVISRHLRIGPPIWVDCHLPLAPSAGASDVEPPKIGEDMRGAQVIAKWEPPGGGHFAESAMETFAEEMTQQE